MSLSRDGVVSDALSEGNASDYVRDVGSSRFSGPSLLNECVQLSGSGAKRTALLDIKDAGSYFRQASFQAVDWNPILRLR